MSHTLAQLIPLVSFLASTAGAGWLASWLFDQARRALPPTRAATAGPLLAWLFAIVNVYLSAPGAFVALAPRLVSTLLAGLRALRAILRPQRPASLVERVARGNPDRNPTALSWRWPR